MDPLLLAIIVLVLHQTQTLGEEHLGFAQFTQPLSTFCGILTMNMPIYELFSMLYLYSIPID